MRCESFHHPSVRNRNAFTVAELLVSMTVMSFIVFALYSMFSQTQKALRSNIGQVDVLESGRMAMEMMSRELAQMSASGEPHMTNLSARIGLNLTSSQIAYNPFVQEDPLEPNRKLRTNVLQDIFFLREETNRWIGTGYRVIGKMDPSGPPAGPKAVPSNPAVGTLYRVSYIEKTRNFRADHRAPSPLGATPGITYSNFFRSFMDDPLIGDKVTIWNNQELWTITNYSRILDGVVHFRLTAFDALGRPLHWDSINTMPYYKVLRLNANGGRRGDPYTLNSVVDAADANVVLQRDGVSDFAVDQTWLTFKDNALPAYVEIELGVLDPVTFKQYESIREGVPDNLQGSDNNAAKNFLKKAGTKVHIFRERIPIRTVTQ